MATLQLKKIAAALAKARGVGQVEDDVRIAGCHVVLRSLRPEEYEQIHADTAEKEDLSYLNAYRAEHLARSIIELNGVDLRSIEMVEVDDVDGNTINVERHEFVRDHVLKTWSREAIDVAFRKFNDLTLKAERQAAEGVRFETPDETPEEKYRRILTELREAEGEVPMDLAVRVLEESGYTKRVTSDDFGVAEERLRNMVAVTNAKTEQAPSVQEELPYAETLPPAAPRPQTMRAAPAPPSAPPARIPTPEPGALQAASRPASPEDLMRLRQPLHGQPPAPAHQSVPPPPSLTRSQKIALEEGLLDPNEAGQPLAMEGGSQIPEVQPQTRLDPRAAAAILDRPPVGGQNKRFRPPPT